MPLGLGHFGDVKKHRHVFLSGQCHAFLVGFDQAFVVPRFLVEDMNAPFAFLFDLHPAEGFRDAALRGLEFLGHADAVTIVPNRHRQGHLQYGSSIHGFPEMAFAGAGIANGAEGHLIALIAEFFEILQSLFIAEDFRCQGKSQQSWHLACCWRDVGRRVLLFGQVFPVALFIEAAAGKVVVHHAPAIVGVGRDIGIAVKLAEKAFEAHHAGSQHKGLVAVISRSPVAIFKRLCHGQLGHLFSIAKYAKFGLTRQHLAPAQQAGLAALVGNAVIVQYFFDVSFGVFLLFCSHNA